MLEFFFRCLLVLSCVFILDTIVVHYWRLKIASRKCFMTILFNYFFILFLGKNICFKWKLRREDYLNNFYFSVKRGGFYTLCGSSHHKWWTVRTQDKMWAETPATEKGGFRGFWDQSTFALANSLMFFYFTIYTLPW